MPSPGLFWKQIHEDKHEQLKSPFFTLSEQMHWKKFEWRLNKALNRLERNPKKTHVEHAFASPNLIVALENLLILLRKKRKPL